jgi:hypothetical protein
MRIGVLAVAIATTTSAIACSSSGGSSSSSGTDGRGACSAYEVASGFDPSTPQVSLRNDVLPIFRLSCGLASSCHQLSASQTGRIYLGSSMDTNSSDAAKVHDGIVNTPSLDLASMPLVKPGDPSNSFLMHKIDGDQCMFENQCTTQSCGLSMPQNSTLLEEERRATIRRWIAQGAMDN